jgi:sugar O-acyltransferase (sialic acid O-acetyltransferase NeuD family)
VSAAHDSVVRLVGLGAGGHATALLDAIHSDPRLELTALVDDDPALAGGELLGFPVLTSEALDRFWGDGVRHAFVGVGGVRSSAPRRAAFARLVEAGFELPVIVHASAVVSPWAHLARGVQILASARVNAGAELENGAIVNSCALVEHECRIGAHAHVGPGVLLAGRAEVGEGAHVGIGAVVIEGVTIGEEALVAAGAVVVKDVEPGTRVAGVPARVMDRARV